MYLPKPLESEIERIVASKALSLLSVAGGCINNCAIFSTDKARFFIKWNDALNYPGMLEAEAKGLRLLHSANAIRIPEVLAVGTSDRYQFLLMEYIHSSRATDTTWKNFGEQLARLHTHSSEKFGLDHSNYIGSLQQSNQFASSWLQFFMEERLQKQLDLAISNKLVDNVLRTKFEKLCKMLPGLLPNERPSLLHGDLWGGNLIVDSEGSSVLVDPAVYYGNREVDLAMTQLFGGFDNRFVEAYNVTFPLISGFEERFRVYNLYPLLVHANLFGRSYLGQLVSCLDYFVLKTG